MKANYQSVEKNFSKHLKLKKVDVMPRLPHSASIELTYRCNNRCRHCWLRISQRSSELQNELSFEEIKDIVLQARRLGCTKWNISGGEPMLRSDFTEIFDFITSKSINYSINTNGSMITPKIAQLLKRKGNKMIALYGDTAEVHDHITRNSGSFDATIQGIEYLREAGANFTIQLIPMRDNYHQFKNMINLARSLTPNYRVGASWLHLSASGSMQQNDEIVHQRLAPREVIELDRPDFCYEELHNDEQCAISPSVNCPLARCIVSRREFHIDPYGNMAFCSFIKDPALRYDLRRGSLEEAWEDFIPSLADKIRGDSRYLNGCTCCELKRDCRWCDVYGYLEHHHHGAKVEYLCEIARENQAYEQEWLSKHRRYYEIAGITLQVDSDLPITDETFDFSLRQFEIPGPGDDTIRIFHHFELPKLDGLDLGKEVYKRYPWRIYRKNGSWIYKGVSSNQDDSNMNRVMIFNEDHTHAIIYNNGAEQFLKGGLNSLTLFRTDQFLLARILADRKGCILHSSAAALKGYGLVFVGHSGAGKSTTLQILNEKVEMLSEDRNIIRRRPDSFRIYSTWSNLKAPTGPSASAPLSAIFFLVKSRQNRLVPIEDRKEILIRLTACLIRPLMTADWWEKSLSLIEQIAREIPCYDMEFDKSGDIFSCLDNIV
jgi:MoaA/NifB/PqqE/SkfB family radical SAM enzyme